MEKIFFYLTFDFQHMFSNDKVYFNFPLLLVHISALIGSTQVCCSTGSCVGYILCSLCCFELALMLSSVAISYLAIWYLAIWYLVIWLASLTPAVLKLLCFQWLFALKVSVECSVA